MIGGIDEAGRGPVIGPMVVAGVAVEDEAPLIEMGVRDSKKVAPKKRHSLAGMISSKFRTHVIVVPASDIDSFRTQMTMNRLEVHLFTMVARKLEASEVFVDAADANEGEFGRSISRGLPPSMRIVSRHKGDELFPVVSAASIVAKSRRDREVERISEELGRDIGSGYPSDPTTIDFMKDWLKENGDLPPHTRRSWKTAARLINEDRQSTLDGT